MTRLTSTTALKNRRPARLPPVSVLPRVPALILGGSITQNNFLGTGNKVSLGLTRSEYQSRYNFGFVDPYWTPDGVSLGYNAFFRDTDYDELEHRCVQLRGGQLRCGRKHRLPDQ